jgi:hypothetical protein
MEASFDLERKERGPFIHRNCSQKIARVSAVCVLGAVQYRHRVIELECPC